MRVAEAVELAAMVERAEVVVARVAWTAKD